MHLYTLGKFELSGAKLSRPKPLLLLSYLCLEGEKDRRYLAELFYQKTTDPMLSLRVALKHLRTACQAQLVFKDAKVGTRLSSDALELLYAYEYANYEQVLVNYQGAFLDGFYLKDISFELEEWVLGTREYLASLARHAQLQVGESLATKGDFAQAASYAEKAYALVGASAPEPKQLELMLNLMESGKSSQTPILKKEITELGLSVHPYAFSGKPLQLFSAPEALSIPNNLVPKTGSFMGREEALEQLSQFLNQAQERLLSITGLGGIGKTRLSLELAYRQLDSSDWDGIYFIGLDALTDPARLPAHIASSLPFAIHGSADPLTQLYDSIGNKKLLLILDNFEHLVQSSAIVSDLLDHCPRLHLLITSRERLNVRGESVYSLRGLEPFGSAKSSAELPTSGPAVQLFIERARSSNLRFQLIPDVLSDITRLCNMLEGTPLAIELAATWVRFMPVKEILQELRNNLNFVVDTRKNTLERHKSLGATFEHSWQLLTANEQLTLKGLAVFKGGFRRDASAAVCDASIPVLASIVDKSLVQVSTSGRYEQHSLLYHFSREKLEHDPDLKRSYEAKHAHFYIGLAETASNELRTDKQSVWLKRLTEEIENFNLALSWTLAQQEKSLILRLTLALGFYWYLSSQFTVGLTWFDRVFKEGGGFDPSLHARALHSAGRLARSSGDFDTAQFYLVQGLSQFETLNHTSGKLQCLNELGILAAAQSQYSEAKTLFKAILVIATEIQNLDNQELAHSNLGLLHTILGEFSEASHHLKQSLVFGKFLADDHGQAHSLNNLALVAFRQEQFEQAFNYYQQSYQLSQNLDLTDLMAESLLGMGSAVKFSDPERARSYLKESLELYRKLSKKTGIIDALSETASLASRSDEKQFALKLWGACFKFREQWHFPMKPHDEKDFSQNQASLAQILNDRERTAYMSEGKLWSLDEAISAAMAWLEPS